MSSNLIKLWLLSFELDLQSEDEVCLVVGIGLYIVGNGSALQFSYL